MASRMVSSRPPQRFELIDGRNVPPIPLRSRNESGRESSQPMVIGRRRTRPRSPTTNATATRAALSASAAAGTIPSGETSTRAASISWQAASVMARARVDCPYTPADRPPSTEMIARLSHTRHAWSAGNCPMRNRRMLFVITLHRASVTAH